jgi:hypothetical protein
MTPVCLAVSCVWFADAGRVVWPWASSRVVGYHSRKSSCPSSDGVTLPLVGPATTFTCAVQLQRAFRQGKAGRVQAEPDGSIPPAYRWNEAYPGLEPGDPAGTTGRANEPWNICFQCNERYLDWNDGATKQLLKTWVQKRLGEVRSHTGMAFSRRVLFARGHAETSIGQSSLAGLQGIGMIVWGDGGTILGCVGHVEVAALSFSVLHRCL